MQEVEEAASEMKGVSEGFVLGLLRAALPPHRIELSKVRMVLRLAVALGYNPVSLYSQALEGRPEQWEKPPLADVVVMSSVEEAGPVESLADVKRVSEKVRSGSTASKPGV